MILLLFRPSAKLIMQSEFQIQRPAATPMGYQAPVWSTGSSKLNKATQLGLTVNVKLGEHRFKFLRAVCVEIESYRPERRDFCR